MEDIKQFTYGVFTQKLYRRISKNKKEKSYEAEMERLIKIIFNTDIYNLKIKGSDKIHFEYLDYGDSMCLCTHDIKNAYFITIDDIKFYQVGSCCIKRFKRKDIISVFDIARVGGCCIRCGIYKDRRNTKNLCNSCNKKCDENNRKLRKTKGTSYEKFKNCENIHCLDKGLMTCRKNKKICDKCGLGKCIECFISVGKKDNGEYWVKCYKCYMKNN